MQTRLRERAPAFVGGYLQGRRTDQVPWIGSGRWHVQSRGLDPRWFSLKLPVLTQCAMIATSAEITGAFAAAKDNGRSRAYQEGPAQYNAHVRLAGFKQGRTRSMTKFCGRFTRGPPLTGRFWARDNLVILMNVETNLAVKIVFHLPASAP